MYLEIVSPEAKLFSGEIESLTVPGTSGSFQVLNNHAPIVSTLAAGQVIIQGSIKLEDDQKNYFNNDIFFAMSHGVHRGILKKGKFDQREIFIENLQRLLPNIKFDLYGMKNNQPIWADNFINALSNSKIGLNLSQGHPVKYYSSDRFAQLIGNGLLVFIHQKTKFSDFFTDKEIVTYKNITDLYKKINKYLKNDKLRKVVASNGRKKYFKYFNSTIVADFIVNKSFGTKKTFYWEKNK